MKAWGGQRRTLVNRGERARYVFTGVGLDELEYMYTYRA